MKKGSVDAQYDEKYIKSQRSFPVGATVLLVLVLAVQITLVTVGIVFQPKPQDLIHQYDVIVEPLGDGSLDIEYSLVWEALDTTEALTWVDIGMANGDFSVYDYSVSNNISEYRKHVDGDSITLRLYFEDAYYGGDTVAFSFKVNQEDMLCQEINGYFYEFVPCWFNAIQVEQYAFVWRTEGAEDYVKSGSLDYGEYVVMNRRYDAAAFAGCETVPYQPFNSGGAYNELQDSKTACMVLCFLFAVLLILAEVYILDGYVSYGRGRGFLTGHGYYVHAYGRVNPFYVRAHNSYTTAHGTRARGFGGGGGCACACACACAGGGRAGCSQKDTYDPAHGWRQKKNEAQ